MKPEFAAHTPPQGSGRWHDLREHLSDVAELAQTYADKFQAGDLGYYAGLWHDLGKYNPEFQDYLRQCYAASEAEQEKYIQSVPHAKYGARLAWDVLMPLAPIIYGHHAGLPEQQHMKDQLFAPELAASYQAIVSQAQQDFDQLSPVIDAGKMISSLVKDAYGYELLTRILFSCLVDADYLDTEEHFEPETARQRGSRFTIPQLWTTLQVAQDKLLAAAKPTPVNQVRAEVYRACVEAAELPPGVFRLAVPTGGGKTRSGLAFGLHHAAKHRLNRVIVAVPYTSIIEQTVSVYREILGEDAVLEHHSTAKDPSTEDARRGYAQARLATQNWDAPLIVTTTVQLFESLFANRPSRCRKLHNIVGSAIILDEVQTLPVSLLEPILSVLRELVERYRVTVVLCTATQPALEGQSRYLQGFESVSDIVPVAQAEQHFLTLRRVQYNIPSASWSWSELAQDLQDHGHKQALIVLNTRKDALDVLDTLSLEQAESSVLHLSTLLCGAHRRQVLAEVRTRLERGEPCLLVSTQVVEAGVDLDFPVVYRAVGPLDRIVQAAGRCNREGKLTEGRVVIFEPEAGRSPKGEYASAIAATLRLLRQDGLDLHSPSIFQGYFRKLYQAIPPDKYGIQTYRASCNFPEVATRFKLIKDDTTSVVIRFDDQVESVLRQIQRRGLFSSDYRALQPYMVSLRDYEFKQAEGLREEVAPGLWMWQGSYDPIKGIGIGGRAIEYDPTDLIQ